MKIDILTLFPEMFEGVLGQSIIKRSRDKNLVEIAVHNLRKWAIDTHGSVDDHPYGGGAGMVIRVDVIDNALKDLKDNNSKVILTDARGKTFNQSLAKNFSQEKHLILIAGHYEGFDHRIHENLADEIISIGDFVLTGGEIPVMTIIDATIRLIPGVINEESLKEESFTHPDTLEYPQYTRPEEYKGWKVPDVLLSGNHKEIKAWRGNKAVKKG